MTKLTLLSGEHFYIKESVEHVNNQIQTAKQWVELPLMILDFKGGKKEVQVRFMIKAIAYWY